MSNSVRPNRNRAHRLSRRAALLGASAGVAGIAGRAAFGAQSSTPKPASTPQAPFSFFPSPTPEPDYPLETIDDQRPMWSGSPVAGGELRLFISSAGLGDYTPTTFRQDFQLTVSYLDPLIRVDDVTLEPKPWLAERWSWGLDGLTLDIELRPNVRWHDGSPLTADDVAFSLTCYRDDVDSSVAFMLAVVSGIEATGETSLTVRFDEPEGTFPYNAGNLPIFSRAQYEAHWTSKPVGDRTLSGFDLGDQQPLGTGPWVIEERSETGVRLRRNDDHFAAVPHAERLVLTVEDDGDAQLDAWRAGEADLVWPVEGADIARLRDRDGYLAAADATVSLFAAFNFGNPLRIDPGWMASPGLREALNQAIDRKGYAESVFGGFIDVERAGIMTQPWAVDRSARNPRRNVAAARALLARNGWADYDGDGVLDSPSGDRGEFVCIVREDEDPNLLAVLDVIGADFETLDFALRVERLDPEAFTLRWTTTFDYDLIALSLNQYAAFSEFDLFGSPWSIRRNAAGWNPGGYWNPEVDEAIFAYLQSWRVAEMKATLATIQRLTNTDPFALWLGFPQQPVLIRPDIAGFQPNKMWQSWNTGALWRSDDASLATPQPATPAASPVASPSTPGATPIR